MNERKRNWKNSIARCLPLALLAGAALIVPAMTKAAAQSGQQGGEIVTAPGTLRANAAAVTPINAKVTSVENEAEKKIAPSLYIEKSVGTAREDYLTAREKLRAGWEHLRQKEPSRRAIDATIRADYAAAMESLNRSLIATPRDLRSYVLGSLIYRSYGDRTQAERYAKQALGLARLRLERDEGDVWAHLVIAIIGTAGEARFWSDSETYQALAGAEARRVLTLCGYEGGQAAYRLPILSTERFFPNFDTSRAANAAKTALTDGDRAFCAMLAAAALDDEQAPALAETVAAKLPEDSLRRALADECQQAMAMDDMASDKRPNTQAFLLKCLVLLPEEIGWGE